VRRERGITHEKGRMEGKEQNQKQVRWGED
jgi:hypothetical protein